MFGQPRRPPPVGVFGGGAAQNPPPVPAQPPVQLVIPPVQPVPQDPVQNGIPQPVPAAQVVPAAEIPDGGLRALVLPAAAAAGPGGAVGVDAGQGRGQVGAMPAGLPQNAPPPHNLQQPPGLAHPAAHPPAAPHPAPHHPAPVAPAYHPAMQMHAVPMNEVPMWHEIRHAQGQNPQPAINNLPPQQLPAQQLNQPVKQLPANNMVNHPGFQPQPGPNQGGHSGTGSRRSGTPTRSSCRTTSNRYSSANLASVGGSRFGQNTIVTPRLAPPAADDMPTRPYASAPFFNMVAHMLQVGTPFASYQPLAHGVVVQSPLSRRGFAIGDLNDPPTPINMGGWEPNVRLTVRHQIFWSPGQKVGTVDQSAFDPYLQAGTVNDRTIGSAINPVIRNQQVARGLAETFLICPQRYDNTSLYMKGAFYALQQARIEQEHLGVVYAPFPQVIPIVHIDIDEAQGAALVPLQNAIESGAFILELGTDIRQANLDVIYWLAAAGGRVQPGAVPSLASFAVHWPPISFAIVRHGGVEPPIPPPAAIPPHRMWSVLRSLALSRAERDFMTAGIYEATQLVHGRLWLVQGGEPFGDNHPDRPDTDEQGQLLAIRDPADIPDGAENMEWYCFTTSLYETCGEQTFPLPYEYNYLHRILKIKRTEETKFLADYVTFGLMNFQDRLLHTSVLACISSIFATTALHTFNDYGAVLQQYINAAAELPPLFTTSVDGWGYFRNMGGDPSTAATFYIQVMSLMDKHIGGCFPLSCMSYRGWNQLTQAWGFLEGPCDFNTPDHPPRFGNPLAIWAFLDVAPCEWGIIDSEASVDFRREVVITAALANRGWYSSNGEGSYQAKRLGEHPYCSIPYGSLAMSAIGQAYADSLPPGEPHFTYLSYIHDRTGYTPPAFIDPHPNPPVWMPGHHIFEPCTVNTYSWANDTIYAPILTQVNAGLNTLTAMWQVLCDSTRGRGYRMGDLKRYNIFATEVQPPPGMRQALPPPPPQGSLPGSALPPGTMQAQHPPPEQGQVYYPQGPLNH